MSLPPPDDLTQILKGLRAGNDKGAERVIERVYEELRAIARAAMRAERPDISIQATDLIHEAYLRLVDQARVDVNDRVHFFALATQVMRRILVDHARARRAQKRGGATARITLSGIELETPRNAVDPLDLHEALIELGALDERQAKIVELRYFGGLECEEVAQMLDVSKTTVERLWRVARAWLQNRLEPATGT
jgi:RNA polymerase sigma-70 factor, ECF subfamily